LRKNLLPWHLCQHEHRLARLAIARLQPALDCAPIEVSAARDGLVGALLFVKHPAVGRQEGVGIQGGGLNAREELVV